LNAVWKVVKPEGIEDDVGGEEGKVKDDHDPASTGEGGRGEERSNGWRGSHSIACRYAPRPRHYS